jgi:hypothetical protein
LIIKGYLAIVDDSRSVIKLAIVVQISCTEGFENQQYIDVSSWLGEKPIGPNQNMCMKKTLTKTKVIGFQDFLSLKSKYYDYSWSMPPKD